MEEAAERPDVDLQIVGLAGNDLGSHVGQGAEMRGKDAFRVGEAHVSQFVNAALDENVLGLYVPMREPVRVHKVYAHQQLIHEAKLLLIAKRCTVVESAVAEFGDKDDVLILLGLDTIVNLDHVRAVVLLSKNVKFA